MKTIKITTDNVISIIDVNFNDFRSIQDAIGGYFETVKTQKMWDYFKCPMMFLADEEGHLKKLPLNQLGSYFYDTERHGWPIVGDIILAVPDGEYILGLEDAEAMKIQLLNDFEFLEGESDE